MSNRWSPEERAYRAARAVYGDPAYGSWPKEAREWERELVAKYTAEDEKAGEAA